MTLLQNLLTVLKFNKKPIDIPEYLSHDAKTLLQQLFQINPNKRLGKINGIRDIKAHSFFKEIDFSKLH